MQQEWMILGATMASVAVLTTGLALAQDEASPLHTIMEQVNAKSLAITKAVRTAVAYKKSRPDVVTNAQEPVKLAQQVRTMRDAVQKAKGVPDAEAQWTKLMDNFTAKANRLATTAVDPATIQIQAFASPFHRVSATHHTTIRVVGFPHPTETYAPPQRDAIALSLSPTTRRQEVHRVWRSVRLDGLFCKRAASCAADRFS